MVFRGTASKRTAALGGAAVVAGAMLSALAIAVAPSARADAPGVGYHCTLALGSAADDFDAAVDFTGSAPAAAQVGDAVQLDGVSVTVHVPLVPALLDTLGARTINGTLSPIEVEAGTSDVDQQTERTSASIVQVSGPVLGPFDLTASPGTVSGFTANKPGTMTFGAGATLNGTLDVEDLTGGHRQLVLTCSRTGAAATIATVAVKDKPKPPTTPPATHSTPPDQDASQPAGLSNGSPSTVAPTGSAAAQSTSTHPQLAKTGFSQTEQLGVGGGLLILVGAGLMFVARRREAGDA